LETPSSFELTATAARDITDRINKASEDLATMLQAAHDGKAWLALGYRSWKDYLAAEIKLSKQHAHRLLAFAQTREEIEKSPMGDLPIPTSERQVRALGTLPPQDRPEVYAKAVEAAGGARPTEKQVNDAVAIARGIEPLIEEPKRDPLQEYRPSPAQVKKYGLNLPPECPGRVYFETDLSGNIHELGRLAILAPLAHDRNFVFKTWLEADDFRKGRDDLPGWSVVGSKIANRAGLERDLADFLDSWEGCFIGELEQLAPEEVDKNEDCYSGPWTYNCLMYFSREEYLQHRFSPKKQRTADYARTKPEAG
jgi:hypothetical protein